MLVKSGLFLFLLTVLQVSARYKSVEPDLIENEIISEPSLSSSSRIISGWLAERGQFPYHASLRFVAANAHVRQCGGSIVSNEWIVTSATCTINRIRAVVHAGGVIFTNSEYFAGTTEWYNHPLFQVSGPELQPNDISLVKLQQPVVYTRFVQPIRIQSYADAYRNYDGQQVIATGNGNTGNSGPLSDVLRWVYLRAISNNECARIYSKVFDTTLCAQYFNVTSQATCSGDNGGPLVHVGSDGVPTLIGVSFFFSIGCDRNVPSGFTRPGPFLPWFQEVTGIKFDQEDTTTTSTSSTTTTTTTTEPTTTAEPTTTTETFTIIDPTTTTTTTEPTTTTETFTIIDPTTTTTTTEPTTTTETATITEPTTTTTMTEPTTTTETATITEPITTTTSTDDSTSVDSTTAPPTDSEEQEPDDVTPEENITAPPTESEEQEPDDVTPEENITAPPTDSEEQEPDDVTPEENITAPPTDSEEQEPDDVTPEENITAPPTDSEEQEPDDVTPEENITAPPTESEEQEPDDVTPEENITAPPEDSEDKEEDTGDDSDCSESNENDEMGQLMKRLQVDVKVKVRLDKYNLTNVVGNEIVGKH